MIAWLQALGVFWNEWGGLIQLGIALLSLTGIVSVIAQYKFQIVQRVKKGFAKILNRPAKAELSIDYTSEGTLQEVKRAFVRELEVNGKVKVTHESKIRVDFTSDVYSISVIRNQDSTTTIEVSRFECGIRDLRKKLVNIQRVVEALSVGKQPVLNKPKNVYIKLTLPFQFYERGLVAASGLKLRNAAITYEDHDTKSEVLVSADAVQLKSTTPANMLELLGRLL